MSNIYVVFDRQSGQIVHTTSFYVIGTEEPIARPEEDVLEIARAEVGAKASLGVARVPDGFDVRDRAQRLEVDVKTGVCRACQVKSGGRSRKSATKQRTAKQSKR